MERAPVGPRHLVELVESRAEMLHAAHRAIVAVDSSQFGRNAFAHIAGLDAISHLVCDKAPQGDLADVLAAAGVRVVVTGAE
ncbi:hypothetical protein SSPO_003820 [Streptomyces antimycoticus]|uniref:DeoR C-terminal sensor domain-containing protein n=1 Tax=Streptomyces antimycoticus TaxID=68175 RepID=A0A499UA87_9ACTN|nr:hypothetical protein SSPO_003820 [Streptomyces antimycoticus]